MHAEGPEKHQNPRIAVLLGPLSHSHPRSARSGRQRDAKETRQPNDRRLVSWAAEDVVGGQLDERPSRVLEELSAVDVVAPLSDVGAVMVAVVLDHDALLAPAAEPPGG
jgi:hypothetical protein